MSNAPPDTFEDEPDPFALLDVVNGGRTDVPFGVPGQDCDAVGWLDPGQLLAFCLDVGSVEAGIRDAAEAHAAYYRIDVDGTATSATLLVRLGPSEPWPWRWDGAWAAPGNVAFTAETTELGDVTGCDGPYLWNGSTVVPIDAPRGTEVFAHASGRVFLDGSTDGCSGGATPRSLAAYDIETEASTVILPPPSPTSDVPVWAFGLSSWAVGDSTAPTTRRRARHPSGKMHPNRRRGPGRSSW